ncbi:HNH endonuclease [Plantactinospora sp. B24E8]|uniref:HNH endonuclease n=1 Tax=Plantactinospora sp. B24E8 TaxID=3153567 RepID=UPI00325C86EF
MEKGRVAHGRNGAAPLPAYGEIDLFGSSDANHTDFVDSPKIDREWQETDWQGLITWMISVGLVTYKEIGSLVLGHLNPSQVGTSIASKKTFQAHYPPRQTMKAVLDWHKEQAGKCIGCGTRLELQADHIETREEYGDAADRLDNMTLRCRRCNVIRRPSHRNGGLTFLTTESALMWILFVKGPRTYQEYERLCRAYGLTMANIRFKEAWAMAHWLAREGLYEIDESSSF